MAPGGGVGPGPVPRRPSLARRLTTATRWPVGIALTSWSYMWRTTPMHRRESTGVLDDHRPPPIAPEVERDELQLPSDGAGPLFHRRYGARIREPELEAEDMIGGIARNPNAVAPSEFAVFQKVQGRDEAMCVGDEYVVRMPAPWDGPVRVVGVG